MLDNLLIVVIPLIISGILAYVGQHIVFRGKQLEVQTDDTKDDRKTTSEKESRLWLRMEQEIKRLDDRIASLEADRARLVKENLDLAQQMGECKTLSDRVEALEMQNKNLKIYNYQLNQRIKILTEDKKALHDQLNTMQRQIKEMGGSA